MDKRTLTALQGSIAKWEAIVWDGGVDKGSDNCPLCNIFLAGGCYGCPVYERTKDTCCSGTPYRNLIKNFDIAAGFWPILDEGEGAFVIDEATHDAAKAELAFLKSLLP